MYIIFQKNKKSIDILNKLLKIKNILIAKHQTFNDSKSIVYICQFKQSKMKQFFLFTRLVDKCCNDTNEPRPNSEQQDQSKDQ